MLKEFYIDSLDLTITEDFPTLLEELKSKNVEIFEGNGFIAFRTTHFKEDLRVKIVVFHSKQKVRAIKVTLSDDFTKDEAYKLRGELETYLINKYGKPHKEGKYQNQVTDQVSYRYFDGLTMLNYLNIIDDKEPRVSFDIQFNNEFKMQNMTKPLFILALIGALVVSLIFYLVFGLIKGFGGLSIGISLGIFLLTFLISFLILFYKKKTEKKNALKTLSTTDYSLIDQAEQYLEDPFSLKLHGLILNGKTYAGASFYFTDEALIVNYLGNNNQVYRATLKYSELGNMSATKEEVLLQTGNSMLIFYFETEETVNLFINAFNRYRPLNFEYALDVNEINEGTNE